jgi:IS30 family transposase
VQRDANEDMHGLVRQYIPKNRDFALVTDEKLIKIKDKLNHRPRKCLGFRTPFEVLFEQPVAFTC